MSMMEMRLYSVINVMLLFISRVMALILSQQGSGESIFIITILLLNLFI